MSTRIFKRKPIVGMAVLSSLLAGATPAALAQSTVTAKLFGAPTQSQTDPIIAQVSTAFGNGNAFGEADLSSGILRASVTAPTGGQFSNLSSVSATFSDQITFSAGASGIASLHYFFDGMITHPSNATDYAVLFITIGTPTGLLTTFSDQLQNFACGQAIPNAVCHQGASISEGGDLALPLGPGTYSIAVGLGTVAYSGDTVDFSHTALLSLTLPEGVTYTSASGHFLEGPVASVPEPTSVSLTLAGLFILAAEAGRRLRRRGTSPR